MLPAQRLLHFFPSAKLVLFRLCKGSGFYQVADQKVAFKKNIQDSTLIRSTATFSRRNQAGHVLGQALSPRGRGPVRGRKPKNFLEMQITIEFQS
jgi:hypothetical protein